VIALENVTKSYGVGDRAHQVLNDITFKFPYRKSVGVLGANGAGKSTLIRIIGGADKPDKGRVIRTSKLSWPMGYSGGFQGTLTGRENARFVARIYGASFEEVELKTNEFAELGQYFDRPLDSYSAGMRSRFAMSLSYALDFDYYLVDEALETGDARLKEKMTPLCCIENYYLIKRVPLESCCTKNSDCRHCAGADGCLLLRIYCAS